MKLERFLIEIFSQDKAEHVCVYDRRKKTPGPSLTLEYTDWCKLIMDVETAYDKRIEFLMKKEL